MHRSVSHASVCAITDYLVAFSLPLQAECLVVVSLLVSTHTLSLCGWRAFLFLCLIHCEPLYIGSCTVPSYQTCASVGGHSSSTNGSARSSSGAFTWSVCSLLTTTDATAILNVCARHNTDQSAVRMNPPVVALCSVETDRSTGFLFKPSHVLITTRSTTSFGRT